MKESREAKQKQKSHKAIKTFRHLPTKMMILVPSCTGEFQFQKRIDIALCCEGMLFTSRAIATRLHQNHLYHLVFCSIQANIRFYRNTTAASDSVLTQFFYLFCECSLLPIYNWRCTFSTFCTHTHTSTGSHARKQVEKSDLMKSEIAHEIAKKEQVVDW